MALPVEIGSPGTQYMIPVADRRVPRSGPLTMTASWRNGVSERVSIRKKRINGWCYSRSVQEPFTAG